MSARITKAEAEAVCSALGSVLAGSMEDAEFRQQDQDPDRLRDLLESAHRKLAARITQPRGKG